MSFVANIIVSFVANIIVSFVARIAESVVTQRGSKAMNGSHHANEEVETDFVADLKPWLECFGPDPRDPRLAVRLVRERVVHVVRQLAMNADRLHSLNHAFSGSFQHGLTLEIQNYTRP